MPDNDNDLGIDHDGLSPAELSDGRGHGIDGGIVEPRVVLVGTDASYRSHFDVHGDLLFLDTRVQT
jgi:hypothetical protein